MTTTEERPVGFGRMPRKEDARFVRGHGTYVDDVKLPGMLHGAVLRSPLAHARIVSVDTSAAEAHPKVKAVITGETLAGLGLAWMPTLSYDTQAVLATDKVRFQGQEVAFVVAEDHYAARDALELIDVEYEPLPPVVDARRALDPDAPVIRDDKEQQTDNHIFDWSAGDKERTDEVFAAADVVVEQDMLYPRVHPAPLETCGTVADMDAITGKLTVWSTTQAPHAHRTLYAMVAGIPEHKIRIISPDIGGGFGNKVGIYPGYVCAVVGSIVTGKPVKWVEDRSENLMSTSFARDYHMHGEIAATQDGKIQALRVHVIADHGAFNATAQPTKFPAGFFRVFTGSYDLAAAHCTVTGVYTNKAPGGVAYACSFRVTEAVYLVERMVDVLADELGDGPGRAADAQPAAARAVPVPDADRVGVRLRRLPAGPAAGDGHGALRGPAPGAGREARARRADGHRGQLLHRGRRRRPAQAHGHPRAGHGRRCRAARSPDRQGGAADLRAVPGPGPRDDLRPDRRRGAGHPARGHRGGARRHRPDPVRARHLRLPLDAGVRSGGGDGLPQGARAREDRRLGDARSEPGRPGMGEGPLVRHRRPRPGTRPWPRSPSPRTPTWSCPRASRASWTRPASTTRRTSPSPSAPTSAWPTWTRTPAR